MRCIGIATVLVLGCGSVVDGEASAGTGDGATSGRDTTGAATSGADDGPGPGPGPMVLDLPGPNPGLRDDGEFLFVLSTTLAPDLPFQFLAATDFEPGSIRIDLIPLTLDPGSTTSPREALGSAAITGLSADVAADNGFGMDLGEVKLPGSVNPITGSDIVATVRIAGTVIADNAYCGTAAGMVLEPLATDLAGSTFAAIRLDAGRELPVNFPRRC